MIVSVASLFAGVSLFFFMTKRPSGPLDSGYTLNRSIRYGFVVQNTTTQPLTDIRLWARAPVQQTATQRCRKVDASHPFEILSDGQNNQVLEFRFETLPPLGTKIVTVSAALELADTPNKLNEPIGPEVLQAERYIESSDPQIQALISDLSKHSQPLHPQEIYNWIAGHVKNASYRKSLGGALHALRHRSGDCTDQALLFVALCRAANIPARAVGGYLCDRDTVLDPAGYHNWAEFYHDGRWRIADPFYRVFDKGEARYVAMRIIRLSDENTLSDMARFRVSEPGVVARMGV